VPPFGDFVPQKLKKTAANISPQFPSCQRFFFWLDLASWLFFLIKTPKKRFSGFLVAIFRQFFFLKNHQISLLGSSISSQKFEVFLIFF
jgi:hypothetical protein